MPENVMNAINSVFCAGCCDDEGTKETIRETFENYGYLCDTHTAVGVNVYEKYEKETGTKLPPLSTRPQIRSSSAAACLTRSCPARPMDWTSLPL